MKPATKNIETNRKQWEPWCMSGGKMHESLKQKGEKCKLPKLNNKKSAVKMLLKKSLKPEAGEGEKSCFLKRSNFPKGNVSNIKTKCKNSLAIEIPRQDNNGNDVTKLNNIPPNTVYCRTFSKYDGCVRKKLKDEFKSNFMCNGKFDEPSSKYNNGNNKAYVKKSLNKKNKSLLRYSMCSSGFDKEMKKKKRSVRCSDLPGTGTYNHRFAYDEALQLHKKGIEVDVLYKVKNKTDSIYVINGEFLWTKSGRCTSKPRKCKSGADRVAEKKNRIAEQLRIQELAKLNELQRSTAANEKALQKQILTRIALVQGVKDENKNQLVFEELARERKIRELEKQRRTELDKKRKILIDKKLEDTPIVKKTEDDVNIKTERFSLLKMQQALGSIYKKMMKVSNTSNIPKICPPIGTGGSEVITDPCVVNDIERWALRDDCAAARAMSWLKIVAGRIDSLDGRVDTSHKNKWMRTAVDRAVDAMTGEKRLLVLGGQECGHRKSVTASSCSFVVKTRRTLRRFRRLLEHRRHAPRGIRKSPKFSSCWCRDDPYETHETVTECGVCR